MREKLKNEIEYYVNEVNEYLITTLTGKPQELYQASSYYIESGGKRLRPIMVIKSCEMFGGRERDAFPAASAVEFIHNFSLIHDDIMDNDDLRHGIPTVHKEFGIPTAILSGDILFSKAFQILSWNETIKESALVKMVRHLSLACVKICEGQSQDIHFSKIENFPMEEEYMEMISKKTAALFEVSCSLGALSSINYTEKDVDNMANFGKNAGIAFQLVDDLIGISGDSKETGKAVGNDIREGKKTYPILLSIKNADNQEKQQILKVFGKLESDIDDLEKAVKIISSLKIENIVRQTAMDYIDKAMNSLKDYRDSDAKKMLQEMAYFIVERSK